MASSLWLLEAKFLQLALGKRLLIALILKENKFLCSDFECAHVKTCALLDQRSRVNKAQTNNPKTPFVFMLPMDKPAKAARKQKVSHHHYHACPFLFCDYVSVQQGKGSV